MEHFKDLLLLFMCISLYMGVSMCETRTEHWILWNWSNKQLWAAWPEYWKRAASSLKTLSYLSHYIFMKKTFKYDF